MRTTTVLCAGMFRSGSTWAYNVVKECLRTADPVTPITAGYFEGDDLLRAIGRSDGSHGVLKFHLGTPAIIDAVRDGSVDLVVYSRRDPMAALASCVDRFCSREPFRQYWTFERAVEHICDGLRLDRDLGDRSNVLGVDLHADGEEESLRRIVRHLGVDLGSEELARIDAMFTFDEMRKRCDQIGTMTPDTLLRGVNDPETLLHAGHVEKGAARDWSTELDPQQVDVAAERFAACIGPVTEPAS